MQQRNDNRRAGESQTSHSNHLQLMGRTSLLPRRSKLPAIGGWHLALTLRRSRLGSNTVGSWKPGSFLTSHVSRCSEVSLPDARKEKAGRGFRASWIAFGRDDG